MLSSLMGRNITIAAVVACLIWTAIMCIPIALVAAVIGFGVRVVWGKLTQSG